MKDYWLITEYQTSGSLYDFLRKNTLSWQQVCNFTLSVLSGLAYLHSESPKSTKPSIAHRDLKSKNVLVKSNGTCCIADFGLALVLKNGKLNGSDIRSQVSVVLVFIITLNFLATTINLSLFFYRSVLGVICHLSY